MTKNMFNLINEAYDTMTSPSDIEASNFETSYTKVPLNPTKVPSKVIQENQEQITFGGGLEELLDAFNKCDDETLSVFFRLVSGNEHFKGLALKAFNETPMQEGFLDKARSILGMDKKPEPVAPPAPEPTEEELFYQQNPASEYRYEYKNPKTGKWETWRTIMWQPKPWPSANPDWKSMGWFGRKVGEGYDYPKRWGLDDFELTLAAMFPSYAHLGSRYEKPSLEAPKDKPGVEWRTIWKGKVLWSGAA